MILFMFSKIVLKNNLKKHESNKSLFVQTYSRFQSQKAYFLARREEHFLRYIFVPSAIFLHKEATI